MLDSQNTIPSEKGRRATSFWFEHVKDQARVPQIVALARAAHDETRLSHVAFDEEKAARIASEAILDRKRHGMFMAFKGAQPIGFAYTSVGGLHIGTGHRLATIHNINVAREVRAGLSGGRAALGLMRGIESWAKARQANEVLLHVTSGVDLARTHKMVKRMGFKFVGGNYAKAL